MPSSFSALRTPFSAMFQKSDELLVTKANLRVLAAGAAAAGAAGAAGVAALPSSVFLVHAPPAARRTASVIRSRGLGARMGRPPRVAVDPSPIARGQTSNDPAAVWRDSVS